MMYVEQDKGQQGSMVLISEFRPWYRVGLPLLAEYNNLPPTTKKSTLI
jgi:hypothetical protein